MAAARKNHTQGANPTTNLLASIVAYLRHSDDMIGTMDNILKQTTDEHGNILIGIDTKDFKLWRDKLEHYVPTKFFGPILIPTNQKVINAILNGLKGGEEAHFAGNRSTDIVAELVGVENIFAPKDDKVHVKHKKSFKDYISNTAANNKVVSPLVRAWLQNHLDEHTINGKETTNLAAQIMLAFLLNPKAAADQRLVQSIANTKEHFIDKATKIFRLSLFGHYESSKEKLIAEITRLYKSDEDSYPNYLSKDYTLPETIEHILALMMVGFDNLQSSLISTLINFAEHSEYREPLRDNIVERDGISFINVVPSPTATMGEEFFKETLRLMPPVWLQARKNRNESRTITYKDEDRNEKSFLLPSATLVLIPNFQLARKLTLGDEFVPERGPSRNIPNPFSSGPNACPGRNIAYAANGVMLAELVKLVFNPILIKEPNYDPKVALKYKDFEIELRDKDKPILKELSFRERTWKGP